MAKRHEIQNLVRRGHIYYWRPRIPRRFIKMCDSHLSLSLHQSCHVKASYMARRLNTLLHEMKMKPVAALTTKDQLEALFRTEATRMAEHLDNLQFAARRVCISQFPCLKRFTVVRASAPASLSEIAGVAIFAGVAGTCWSCMSANML